MIEIGNLKINYFELGQGKPLLILHGWLSKAEAWRKTAELISKKGFRVIVPDLPGFGQSSKLDRAWTIEDYSSFVNEFVDKLGIDQFYILGHSFGGALALRYCLTSNKPIKLFLVSAAIIRRKKTISSFLLNTAKKLSFIPFYSLLRKAFYKYILKSDYLLSQGVMQETYLNIIKEDLSSLAPSVVVDTTIIWGNKDKITPLEHAYFLSNEIKGSKLEILDGGHDLEIGNPEELASKII